MRARLLRLTEGEGGRQMGKRKGRQFEERTQRGRECVPAAVVHLGKEKSIKILGENGVFLV